MLDVFHIAKPQNCDIQIFNGIANQGSGIEYRNWRAWNKPRGVSHVYMLLIGGGGFGNLTNGGGSGAITVWYGSAQNVPDSLEVYVRGMNALTSGTFISYRSTTGSQIDLLSANSSSSTAGATTTAANEFAALGFYSNTAGDSGPGGAVSASATSFLSAGSGGTVQLITANYGYITNSNANNGVGYFQMQPIIVGVGSATANYAAIGCGTNDAGSIGGPGMALIASW